MKSDPAGVVRKFGVGVIQNQAKSVVVTSLIVLKSSTVYFGLVHMKSDPAGVAGKFKMGLPALISTSLSHLG
ncbi:hypothetical protein AVEN_55486-1 [Araneus ventricosus]|uniref:Uncharacterized protein n=1 Tax=Araneus ventricosus TaxID=182803 RepID=A0A4Y2X6Z7_ARAVE|nr:hypothetical protein AVEN_55486-1 [Araneus ventricosus]